MKNTSIVKILIFLYFVEFLRTEWTFNERPYTFSCIYSKDNLVSIVWQNQAPRTLFACQYNMIPTCIPAEDKDSVEYAANMTVNSLSYISVFTIKHVSLSHHNTTWSCQVNFGKIQNSTTFYLDVFAIPKTPSCHNATLVDDGIIQLQCLTDIVIPPAICEFYVHTNAIGGVKLTNGSIAYKHQPSSTNGYNRTECTYTVSVCSLGHGLHWLSVVMYPNITSEITDEMKSMGQYKVPVKIDLPDAPVIYGVINSAKRTSYKNMLSLYEGFATIICELDGSFPLHKNICLICDNIGCCSSNYALLILNTSTLSKNSTCTCNVWWIDNKCISKNVTVYLSVEQYQSNSDTYYKEAAIWLGVTAGILALALLVALTVFIVRRNKNKNRTKSNHAKNDNYSDIRENPHKYEMPVFASADSAQEELTTTGARGDTPTVETNLNSSIGQFLKTDNKDERKHEYTNEQNKETTTTDEYHHYDEPVTDNGNW